MLSPPPPTNAHTSTSQRPQSTSPIDPVFRHARREALVILLIWLVALLWAVPYCYLNGFGASSVASDLDLLWGMPRWVVLGIGLPWLAADVATIWFCFVYMRDDDLEPVPPTDADRVAEDRVTTADPEGNA